jgi:RNA polymerase sigma factor FliA
MCPELQILWREFEETRSIQLRRQLVVQYLDLVRYVVSKFNLQYQGRAQGLDYNDVVHFGVLGLLGALDRYTSVHGVKFETYAVPRIRGAILDELRKLDWVPRSVRESSRRVGQATHQVAQERGREPVDVEVASRLSMSVEEYHRLVAEGAVAVVRRSEVHNDVPEDGGQEEPADADALSPLDHLNDKETKAALVKALEALPERDRTIIALYYYEGLRLAEIGKVLEITESRVSQIHSEVLRQLRKTLWELKA